jgi:ABC-type Zn2+ transport system substrate-binding protein/surface adhesin
MPMVNTTFVQTNKEAEAHHEEGEKEGDHKEGEEKDHKEDKTAKNFEKVEVLKGVSIWVNRCNFCK